MRLPCLTLLGLLGCAACGGAAEPERAAQARERFQVLVFTKTTGFRHDSIPDGVKAIQRLGRERGLRRRATATPGVHHRLAATTPWSSSPPPDADRARRAAAGVRALHPRRRRLRRRPRRIGHRGRWPWYEGLVGARFKRHDPGVSRRAVRLEDSGPPRPAACRRPGSGPTSGTSSARTRAARSMSWRAGRIASARLVPRLRWRPFGVHRDGTYAASHSRRPASSRTSTARSRWRPAARGSTVRRERLALLASRWRSRAAAARARRPPRPRPRRRPSERHGRTRARPGHGVDGEPGDQLGDGRSRRRDDHDRHRPGALPRPAGREGGRASSRPARDPGAGTVSGNLVVRFAGPGDLLASGHPQAGDLPENLGLIRSRDHGDTWRPSPGSARPTTTSSRAAASR